MKRWKKYIIVLVADMWAMIVLLMLALGSMMLTHDFNRVITSYGISLIYCAILCFKLYLFEYIIR